MTDYIDDIATLETIYGTPSEPAVRKVTDRLVPVYRKWVEASRFVALATVGPEGTDCSPRGDDGPVVQVLDDTTLALPDWHGNNRVDSLRNIVADGRVSLMFMVPGSTNVIRINGRARLTVDEAMRARFERSGRLPRSVIVIGIGEVYFQCARAVLRAGLWTRGDESGALPTAGEMLAAVSAGEVGGAAYDADWKTRAGETMW